MELRPLLGKIPPVIRPLLFLVLPVILLHTMFMRTPAGPAPANPLNRADAPRPEDARAMIEQSEVFRAKKTASCPVSGRLEDLQRYPLFGALRSAGYLTPQSLEWNSFNEVRPEVTQEARTSFAGDLTDDGRTIDAVVARKTFDHISSISGPPQALSPPLQYATRIDFIWRWSPANRIAGFLNFATEPTPLSGTAYFLRDPNTQWRLAQIDVSDFTPDLSTPR